MRASLDMCGNRSPRGIARRLLLLTAAAFLGTGAIASAATINVTTTSATPSSTQCSLYEAVQYADGNAEPGCASSPASGTTTIMVPAGTYNLAAGSNLHATGGASMIIMGSGESTTTIAATSGTVLSVDTGVTVTVSGVTLTGGTATAPGGGGVDNSGTLTLSSDQISGNTTGTEPAPPTANQGDPGGGVANFGSLTITGSTITDNITSAGAAGAAGAAGSPASPGQAGGAGGAGAGLFNASGATATVSQSTISDNTTGVGGAGGVGGANATGTGAAGGAGGVGGAGGGIDNQGTMAVGSSTISGNATGAGGAGGKGGMGGGAAGGAGGPGANGGPGGGIASSTGITVSNSTIVTNSTAGGGQGGAGGTGTTTGAGGVSGSGGEGGGLSQLASSGVLLQDTLANNAASGFGGGIDIAGLNTNVTETSTIVAGNTRSGVPGGCNVDDPSDHFTDGGNNLQFGDTGTLVCPGITGNPLLATLADNGGPTQTMALTTGSPAIGLVPSNACPLTMDQRGVSRPQAGRCDAGAYEYAPPAVMSAAGMSTGTTSATVTASVSPNLTSADTMVSVNYGTTSSYTMSTTQDDIGNGNTPVAFTASLTGLQPNTTYHFNIVAVNGDGTSATGDARFTTAANSTASISHLRIAGTKLTFHITCKGGPSSSSCFGPIKITSHVKTKKGKVVAVAAAAAAAAAKPKPTGASGSTSQKTVATGKYSLKTGQTKTVSLSLNKTGRGLINRFYKVPATVTLGGPGMPHAKTEFRYTVLRPLINYQFSDMLTVTTLTVTDIPRGAKLELICTGGGCPARSEFVPVPKSGVAPLAPLFKGHLHIGTKIEVKITAPNAVGKVFLFKVRRTNVPASFYCQPPKTQLRQVCQSAR